MGNNKRRVVSIRTVFDFVIQLFNVLIIAFDIMVFIVIGVCIWIIQINNVFIVF